MTRRALYCILLFLLSSSLLAKDKNNFPALITNAKYVFVTTYFGDDLADSRLRPADRQAVANVQDAIRDWGLYTIVYERRNADLILLVRKGGVAEVRQGVGIHAGSTRPTSVGPITDADAGDPLDMLAVYDASRGIDTAPLWRDRIDDGLDAPQVRLVKELREKVEAAAKKP
jgi:hypothetical protein